MIALTGVTADADTRRIEAAGVRKVLTKPVNVARLLAALRDTLSDSDRRAEGNRRNGPPGRRGSEMQRVKFPVGDYDFSYGSTVVTF